MKSPNNLICHYTSLKSCLGIVQNKSLWLTNLSSSNDRKELFYSPANFLRMFSGIESSSSKNYFQRILDDNEEKFKSLANEYVSDLFSISFSKKKDYLPNWKMYGDDFKGVCFCFDRENLEKAVKGLFQIAYISEIMYSEKSRRTFIKENLDYYYSFAPDVFKNSDDEKIIRFALLALSNISFMLRCFSKTNHWQSENEVRLLFSSDRFLNQYNLLNRILQEDQFKSKLQEKKEIDKTVDMILEQNYAFFGNSIKQYRKLFLGENMSSMIPEIILGPMCQQNKNEFEMFLKHYGFTGTIVTESTIPIR